MNERCVWSNQSLRPGKNLTDINWARCWSVDLYAPIVCPVDCFVEGPNFLAINPDECIDCTLCVAECPAEAIFAEDDVPADQQDFIKINADMSKIWPVISSRKEPLPDADSFNGKPNKRSLLDN